MPDDRIELWGVYHLAQLAGMDITNIHAAKAAFGPAETGIDVVFDLAGQRSGAQHTIFHFDEGQVPGKRGSPAHATEEATARAQQTPFGMRIAPDYRSALARRINEKIALEWRYDLADCFREPQSLGWRGIDDYRAAHGERRGFEPSVPSIVGVVQI
jgi:hypothetical protein